MPRVVRLPPDVPLLADGAKVGGWWHESEGQEGTVACDLCPRACAIVPGKRGFCFVRENRDGQVVSSTYGRSTGFCVDPIEKKPLGQFYPGSAVLSFGTAGCNLGCKFCQNWTSSRSRDVDAGCEVADAETIAEAARQLGCRSVAFTYNDPIVFAEYAIDTARACREAGVKTVAVTSGYITAEARSAFFRDMDAANVDLKAFSERFYDELCGGHLQPVLDTLRWLIHQSKTWVEITNLIIPQANDSPDELQRMCDWIVEELNPDVPVHFSAFHPDFKVTDRGPTPRSTLVLANDIARAAGLKYVYTGNISDRERQSTYCPGCGRMVIERDGYILGVYDLREDRCRHCNEPIAGRFDPVPGDWGGRRQPVQIAAYARPARAVPITEKEINVAEKAEKQESSAPEKKGRPELTDQQEALICRAAARRVTAAVTSQAPPSMKDVLAEVAGMPLYGAFVSLKRSGQLRSCCGFLGQSIPLWEAVDRAADRAAKDDPRFPPISPTELEHLDMEVWLLWDPQPVAAKGEDRVAAVTIGEHGLQISRGANRGLLLPGVAIDHNLDAQSFLKQVCLKAGLPTDAWRDDDTTLMTFEGYAIRGRIPAETDSADRPAPPGGPTRAELAALVDFCHRNVISMVYGATPSYYMPGAFDGNVCAVAITIGERDSGREVEVSSLSVRPEIPLQSTLFSLIEAAARALLTKRIDPSTLQSVPVSLSVLWDPAMHGTANEPELGGIDPKQRAVLVIDASRSACVFDPQKTPEELLAEAVRRAELPEKANPRVLSMAVISTDPQMAVAHVPRPQPGPETRPAAVAGAFYPGTAEEIDKTLDDMLPQRSRAESWPAVMVPHAGWIYSGRLAAKVFGRLEIPEQVIILCPKHRAGGSQWAVAPHRIWSLPGRDVPSDPELAAQLAEAVSGLDLDALAHRQEHAIEVQLPLLARLAPNSRVVGITIAGGELSGLQAFAAQMAKLLDGLPSRPLLVISSDMNHFADDAVTRRLDRLALDAMESLDPVKLYDTVRDNGISMCGVLPAVIVMETLRNWGCLSRCEAVGYSTSAEAGGDTSRVVGYAGMLLR